MQRRQVLAASALAAFTPAIAAAAPTSGASHARTKDGAQLFVRDWGSGPPIVFLAGWSLPSDMWSYQMQPLSAAGFRCIAFDRRGHGRSDDPGRGYDYDTLAGDLEAVLAARDVRGATVVAHSMAGGEAVRHLARYGAGRVERLLLLAPTTPCLVRKDDNPGGIPAELLEANRAGFLADFPRWIDANTEPFFTPATSAGVKAWTKGLMLECSMKALAECNRAMIDADFRAELARLRLPVRVVHGDRDASAPLDLTGRPTAALVPGATLSVYEGAPHGLYVTHAARLNAEIAAFAKS